MKVKVSHESPIALLNESQSYNDYDYCLVHLMETHPEYRDYFLNARKVYDREVLLDNSIFELKQSFEPAKYIKWVQAINPNSFIVPDVLEDATATINKFVEFNETYKKDLPDNIRKIGAVQGKQWQDILDCYRCMSEMADIIAISFDFSYYNIIGEGYTWEEKMDSGRKRLVEQLIEKGVWNWDKPHHMLGTATPQGCSWFKEVSNIRSCDTSNPVVHGLHGIKYNSTFGLKTKIKTKLADMIEAKPTEEQIVDIYYNTRKFQEILNG